jgi:site-specific DNA recombinase
MLILEELEQAECRVEFVDHPMSQDPHDQLSVTNSRSCCRV